MARLPRSFCLTLVIAISLTGCGRRWLRERTDKPSLEAPPAKTSSATGKPASMAKKPAGKKAGDSLPNASEIGL